ncbi:phage tail assembly chaperone [Aurantimonas sp. NFXS3]|uniref:phage tail assembly chaperone n=1 Tax=Aurantimonas sp. NFXS3 TaxID=2818434 RepID=UPI003B8B4F24
MAEKKIDGVLYSVTPILAKRALVLQARLTKVLGPAMPAMVKAFASRVDPKTATDAQKAEADRIAMEAGLQALRDISESIDPEAFGNLIEDIVQLAEVQEGGRYRRVIMDQDFTGNLQGILPVVGFVLQEQFGDFFTALTANGARKLPAKP